MKTIRGSGLGLVLMILVLVGSLLGVGAQVWAGTGEKRAAPLYQWHTFYPARGLGFRTMWGMDVDGAGNTYFVGKGKAAAWASDAALTPLHVNSGGDDMLVMKLDAAGAYQWHTFYGSEFVEQAQAVKVDGNGNVYVVGWGNGSWAPGEGVPIQAFSGSENLTVLKLNAQGAYQWHTFVPTVTYGNAVALDQAGNLYIAGSGAPDGIWSHETVMKMVKLNSNGVLQWEKSFLWDGEAEGSAIAVAGDDSIYVAGWTTGYIPDQHTAGADLTIVKLDSQGNQQWYRFYPSDNEYPGHGVALTTDSAGNLYVASSSLTLWNGTGEVAPLHPPQGGSDLVVLKLNPQGGYQWHTYYGGYLEDYAYGIAVRGSRLYVTGVSETSWVGDSGQLPANPYTDKGDWVIFALDTDGHYVWHAFYGGADQDEGRALALGPGRSLYAAGMSWLEYWNGANNAAPLHAGAGDVNLAVMKLEDAAYTAALSTTVSGNSILVGQPVVWQTRVLTPTGGVTPTGWITWELPGPLTQTGELANGVATITVTFMHAGPVTVTARYNGDENFSAAQMSWVQWVEQRLYLPLVLRAAQP